MVHRSNSQSGPASGVGVRPVENGARLIALLGPTNTGKTHFAMERMLGHATGMIGFPLRLLARENYDRVVAAKGAQAVALVTGEEKIIPRHPRYWVCTVESMPLDRPVECLAVDEIQLAADPERGHIFTDRLLHARGLSETIFLGSDTAWNLVRRLAPGIERIQRPRLSTLTYAGAKKLTRLPPRSAVVAFSATEVYESAVSAAARRWCWARFPRAPATPRWRFIRPARSIIWSRPTPSAWASTWMSTMSPSLASPSSTASARAG
jgi:hypothetical protein